MRKMWTLVFGFILTGAALFAQGGMTLYNMPYIPQASYLNPGNTPHCNFYLSLPGISGIGAGLNNNFFSLNDIDLRLSTLNELDPDSLISTFASVAQSSNSLGLRGSADLFGFGLRSDRHYISFYIREEFQGNLDFPDELFRFLDDYSQGVVSENTPYLMSGSRFTLTQYRPFTLQYAYDIAPSFTLGGKVSYISGIFTIDASNDTLIAMTAENSKGFDIVGRMRIRTGGFIQDDTSNIKNVFINPQNSGFAFGLGGRLTTLDDRLDLSFSAVNIGRIIWNQKVGESELNDGSFENTETLGEILDTLLVVKEKANFSFNQALTPEFYLGANYFVSKGLSVSALLRASPVYQNLQSSFGLFFNARASNWLGFTAGYLYANQSHNIPVGLTIQPGPFQLYVVTDNALGFIAPESSRQFHLNAGLNLTFGKTSRPWTEKQPEEGIVDSYPGVYQPEAEEEEVEYQTEPPVVEAQVRDTIISPVSEPLYNEDETDITSYLVTNPIYLHRGPSGNTTVLDTIAPNTVITVLQKKIPDWWYVEYGNQSGWIQPRSIRPSMEMPVSEQQEDDIPADPVVSFVPQPYIMLDNTAMREGPMETARETHWMKKWDEVLVLEKTNSSWWKIRHNGNEGYVKSAVLNPRPENYVRPEEDFTKPAPPAPKQKVGLGVYVITSSTSLRSQATHQSNSLMRLRTGTEVRLLEKTSALWWKVEVNGLTGYAKAANLSSQ